MQTLDLESYKMVTGGDDSAFSATAGGESAFSATSSSDMQNLPRVQDTSVTVGVDGPRGTSFKLDIGPRDLNRILGALDNAAESAKGLLGGAGLNESLAKGAGF